MNCRNASIVPHPTACDDQRLGIDTERSRHTHHQGIEHADVITSGRLFRSLTSRSFEVTFPERVAPEDGIRPGLPKLCLPRTVTTRCLGLGAKKLPIIAVETQDKSLIQEGFAFRKPGVCPIRRPSVILWKRHHSRLDRISMDVLRCCCEVGIRLQQRVPKAALEQVSRSAVAKVEALRVNPVDVLERLAQFAIVILERQVDVIGHQAIRQHPTPMTLGRFPNETQHRCPVAITAEDRHPVIAASCDVVDSARWMNTQLFRHPTTIETACDIEGRLGGPDPSQVRWWWRCAR